MAVGYYTESRKNLSISIPKNVWTPIHRVTDLAVGPTLLNVQIYGDLPGTKPKDIRLKWVRLNGPGTIDDDTTATHATVVGTITNWSCSYMCIEYIKKDELPYELHIWQNASSPVIVTTIITKAINASAYIADRIALE